MRTWELRLLRRTTAFSVLLALAAFAIVAATDEGALLSTRLDRTVVLLPILGAFSVWLSLRGSTRARGELRALLSTGASPERCARAAVVGAMVPAIAGLVWASRSRSLVDAFLPTLTGRALVVQRDAFVDPVHGLSISARSGVLSRLAPSEIGPREHAFFPWLALLFTLASLSLAVRVARLDARSLRFDAARVGLWLFSTTLLLHLAGGGRIALPWTLVPTMLDSLAMIRRWRQRDT